MGSCAFSVGAVHVSGGLVGVHDSHVENVEKSMYMHSMQIELKCLALYNKHSSVK